MVNKLTTRWFQPADYGRISPQEVLRVSAPHYASLLHQMGPAITWLLDGQPVAAAGLVTVWPATAEAWTIIGPPVSAVARSFHYSVRRTLNLFADVGRYHRIQTYVDASEPRFQRWAESLGFVREATMLHWGPHKENYMLYAWFPWLRQR